MLRNKVVNEINIIIGRMIANLDEKTEKDKISILSEARSRIMNYLTNTDIFNEEADENGKFQHRWHNYDGNIF